MSSPVTSTPGDLLTKSVMETSPGNEKRSTSSPSSPSRCPICLSSQENPAKGDECTHKFCFPCLKEWSRVKAECPLCKKSMTKILYGENNSKEYVIPTAEPSSSSDPYRATAEWWYHHTQEHQYNQRRMRESRLSAIRVSSNTAMIRQRRHYYWRGIKVSHVDQGNRVRQISPKFFRTNQVQTFRLIPWLKRELTALFGSNNRQIIERVREVIMSAIRWIKIESEEFFQELRPYFLQHTEHFIHEFVHFARSPFDIHEYDRHAVYTHNNGAPLTSTLPTNHHPHPMSRPFADRWNMSPEPRTSAISDSTTSSLPSSQSMLLSQTTWDDDDLTTVDPRPLHSSSSERTNPLFDGNFRLQSRPSVYYMSMPPQPLARPDPIASYSYSFLRDTWAPLNSQSVDTVANTSERVNEIEQKYERFEKTPTYHINMKGMQPKQERRRKRKAHKHRRMHAVKPVDVIVISSSSEDERPRQRGIKEDATTNDEDQQSEPANEDSGSEVEFVNYIKPTHLRTPDAFINLDSDSDKPGPSQPRTSATPPRALPNSSPSSVDSPIRNPRMDLKRTATIFTTDEPDSYDEKRSKIMKIKPKKISSFIKKANYVFENANAWRNKSPDSASDSDTVERPKRTHSAEFDQKSSTKRSRRMSLK